jgi:hypothetical protein
MLKRKRLFSLSIGAGVPELSLHAFANLFAAHGLLERLVATKTAVRVFY